MKIGDIVAIAGAAWTIVRLHEAGSPGALRTTGRPLEIHLAQRVEHCGCISFVRSRRYEPEGDYTEIELGAIHFIEMQRLA